MEIPFSAVVGWVPDVATGSGEWESGNWQPMAGGTKIGWANQEAARQKRGVKSVAPSALREAETLVDAPAWPGRRGIRLD